MHKKIFYLSVFLAVYSAAFAGVNDKGIEFYRAGMYDAAKNFFAQSNSRTSDENAVAFYYSGLLDDNAQKYDLAAAWFQKAIEIAPKSPCGYIGLGRMELQNGNIKAAEAFFKKAESLSKKNADVLVNIADAFFAKNMAAKAETVLEKAKNINLNFADIYLLEGNILIKQNRIGEAQSKFETAIYYASNNKLALIKLAQSYEKMNRQDIALDYVNQAFAIDRDYLPAYIALGDIKYGQAKNKEAIEAYEKVLAACEPPFEVFERYAQALYFDSQYEKSLRQIQYVLQKKPDAAIMHRLEAYNNYELEKYELGLQKMEKFLASIPYEKQIYLDFLTLGRLYVKQKKYENAVESFNKALVLAPENPDIYREIADAYGLLDNYENAVKNYEKYFELNPNYLNMNLYSFAEICIAAAGSLLAAYSPELAPESVAENKQIFDRYIEKGAEAYSNLIRRAPDSYLGYYGRANVYALVDAYSQKTVKQVDGVAKPFYEEALVFLSKNNADGSLNRYIIVCYNYFSSYYIMKDDTKNVIDYNKKILAIDPENAKAKDNLKKLKVKF